MRVVGPRRDGVRPARRRAAVVAGGGRAPAARGARPRPPAGRRGARRVRPGGLVRGPARRHRGRRADLLARLRSLVDAGVVVEVSDDQFWFSHALVADAIVHQLLGRERRRLHERCFEAVRRAPVLDHASLAYHAQGADRHDEVPGIARRGAARYLEKGLTFSALRLAAEGLAEAPNDSELLAVATEAAWRLDFGAEALATAAALGEGGRRAARPHRRPALRRPRCTTSSTTSRRRWPGSRELEAMWSALDDRQLRGVAAWSLAQLHMISDRSVDAVAWAERALVDARGRRRHAHRGAGARRAGRGDESSSRSRREALGRVHEALDAARRSGDAVLLTRAINNGLELVPVALGRGGRAARRDAGRQLAASASTSSARRRPWRGSSRPPTAPATCRCCAGSAPRARSGGAAEPERKWMSAAQVGFALEEGRLVRRRRGVLRLRRRARRQAPALPAPRHRPGRGAGRPGDGRAAVRGARQPRRRCSTRRRR